MDASNKASLLEIQKSINISLNDQTTIFLILQAETAYLSVDQPKTWQKVYQGTQIDIHETGVQYTVFEARLQSYANEYPALYHYY